MKEMIIVNNDGKCEGCDMCYHVHYGGYYCKASKDKMIGNNEAAQKKPEWCPLIPIKKKKKLKNFSVLDYIKRINK